MVNLPTIQKHTNLKDFFPIVFISNLKEERNEVFIFCEFFTVCDPEWASRMLAEYLQVNDKNDIVFHRLGIYQ